MPYVGSANTIRTPAQYPKDLETRRQLLSWIVTPARTYNQTAMLVFAGGNAVWDLRLTPISVSLPTVLSSVPSILSSSKRFNGAAFFFTGVFSFRDCGGDFGIGLAQSSVSQSIFDPLYVVLDLHRISKFQILRCLITYIMQVRANMALWTEFVLMWTFWASKVTAITTRLWMWSKSFRITSSVCLGLALRMIRFLVAPIAILLATDP